MARIKYFFPCLLFASVMAHAARHAMPELPQILYIQNEDLFHQEQFEDLYTKTALSLHSAARTVLESDMYSKSLGLPYEYHFRFPILIVIKDIPEDSLYRSLRATAGWRRHDDQWMHVLTLNLGAYVQHPEEDLNLILAHEMAHIVLADFMGVQETSRVPVWLNEGFAQSVTDEGRKKVHDLAVSLGWNASMLIPCQLDASVDTFAHGEGNGQCYPEYYLAAQRVNQLGGETAAGKMLRELKDDHSVADAFFSATGKPYSMFQQDVDGYMAAVVTDRQIKP